MEQIGCGDRHLRGVDLGEGERAEDVDDDLHIDLAHALERAPVEGVLVQQFSGPRGLYMAAAEVDGVALEQADLRLRQHVSVCLHVLLQAHQPLVASLQPVAMPHAAHAGRAHLDALETQLIGDALRPVSRELQGVVEDLLLDLGRHAVGVRVAWPPSLFDERRDAAYLEGATNLVERVAVIPHELARF